MMRSVKTSCRLLFVPTVCVFFIFSVWTVVTDIDKKESRLSEVISRLQHPVKIFVSDDGDYTLNTVNTTPYMSAKQMQNYAYGSTSDEPVNGEGYSTIETAYDEDVQDDGVDEEFLQEREKVYSERRQRVEQVCQQLGPLATYDAVKNAPLRRLRWLNARNLVMCFNAKVGTSSWSQYLLDVARPGLNSTRVNMHAAAANILRPRFSLRSRKSLKLLEQYKKIMIVRHPFARVVSAYLDKIVGGEYRQLSRAIIRTHRPRSSSLTSRTPTLTEFVKYLVSDVPLTDNIEQKHFGVANIHWMPFYANCAPCDIHYDVILTMETIADDTRYINHQFRLGLKQQLQKNHHAPNSSESSAVSLFKTVPNELILALYKRYRVDFDMFGYSTYPFLPEA